MIDVYDINKEQNTQIITKKVERQSGLELLRIIAMIMIVLHHFVLYSGLELNSLSSNLSADILKNGGKLGVNIFVLISAYFMVNKKFKWSRVLNIVLQTLFYTIAIFIIFLAFDGEIVKFNQRSFLENFFPLLYDKYWFVTAYVLLLLVSPILNLAIKNMSEKLHLTICIALTCLLVLFPYFNMLVINEAIDVPLTNSIVWFIALYFIGAYIGLHVAELSSTSKAKLVLLLLTSIIFQIVYTIIVDTRESWADRAIGNTSIAIILLLFFKDLKFRNKFVNSVAVTTFGVYLIHENPYIRGWWWNFLVNTFSNFIKNYVLLALTLTLITFILFSIIDYIRLKTIHRLTQNLLNKIDKKIETHTNICNKQKE